MAGKIIHKHTSKLSGGNPQLPTSEQVDYGELAINYATGHETIALKNSNNEIIEFKSKDYFEKIITDNKETISESLKQLNDAVSDLTKDKQDLLVNGETIKTINGESILGRGKIEITAESLGLSSAIEYCGMTTTEMYDGYSSDLVYINGKEHHAKSGCVVIYGNEEYIFNGVLWNKLGYPTDLSKKQDTLVSGHNIKTLDGESILGEGDIKLRTIIEERIDDIEDTISNNRVEINDSISTLRESIDKKQDTLVSGYNIKTIGGEDITGNGNIELKLINGESIIGRGEITINADTSDIEKRIDAIEDNVLSNKLEVNNSITTLTASISNKQDTLISGYNVKTIGSESIIGSGDIKFKTINGSSIIGDGNIVVEGSGEGSNIEIVNDLTTGGEDKVLSAEMGKELNEMIQNIDFDSTYNTTLEGTLATESAIGGIPKGTTVESLTAKTLTQLFDDLLFPTKYPSHTNPSVGSFNLSSTERTVKLGSNVLTFANEVTLNKGVWSQYNNNMVYTGDKTGVTYTAIVNGTTYTGTTYSGLTLPTTYTTLGNHTYKARIGYAAGSDPKDNKGNTLEGSGATASYVDSSNINVNVTLPWYATTEEVGVLTEQTTLIAWNNTSGTMSTGEFSVKKHETSSGKLQMFALPRALTEIQQYGTTQFDVMDKTTWSEETYIETINGIERTYYKYTYKGTDRGSVKLKLKF